MIAFLDHRIVDFMAAKLAQNLCRGSFAVRDHQLTPQRLRSAEVRVRETRALVEVAASFASSMNEDDSANYFHIYSCCAFRVRFFLSGGGAIAAGSLTEFVR